MTARVISELKYNYEWPCLLRQTDRLLAYIDETAIFYANGMPEKIEYVINADLANVDKWYEANGMRRNTQNTN